MILIIAINFFFLRCGVGQWRRFLCFNKISSVAVSFLFDES